MSSNISLTKMIMEINMEYTIVYFPEEMIFDMPGYDMCNMEALIYDYRKRYPEAVCGYYSDIVNDTTTHICTKNIVKKLNDIWCKGMTKLEAFDNGKYYIDTVVW